MRAKLNQDLEGAAFPLKAWVFQLPFISGRGRGGRGMARKGWGLRRDANRCERWSRICLPRARNWPHSAIKSWAVAAALPAPSEGSSPGKEGSPFNQSMRRILVGNAGMHRGKWSPVSHAELIDSEANVGPGRWILWHTRSVRHIPGKQMGRSISAG